MEIVCSASGVGFINDDLLGCYPYSLVSVLSKLGLTKRAKAKLKLDG